MHLPVELAALVAALAITFFAATVQGLVGIGLGVLSVPLLTLIDPVLTPVPQMLVTLPLATGMFLADRDVVEWAAVVRISLGRLPGVAIGLWLLAVANDRVLDGVIGAIVIGTVVLLAAGLSIPRTAQTEAAAGMAAGAAGTVSSIGGPAIALLYRDHSGPVVRGNLGAIMMIGIVTMIVARAATGHIVVTDLEAAVCLTPAVGLGLVAARRLSRHIDGGPALRLAILAVSGAAGSSLLVRSLW